MTGREANDVVGKLARMAGDGVMGDDPAGRRVELGHLGAVVLADEDAARVVEHRARLAAHSRRGGCLFGG